MNRKRYGSFALLLILLTTLIMILLAPVLYGDNNPVYEYKPLRQKYAIANKSQFMNDDFYRNYVLTDAKWAYNSIRFYTDDGVNDVLDDEKLGETELNYSTDKANFTQDYSRDLYNFDPILYRLSTKGDLLVNFCVSLASTSRSSQRADILHYTDYVNRYGNGPFISYGAKEYFRLKGSFTLHYEYKGASFAHAKNHALVFADDIYPDVQSVYATKEIDGPKNFKYADNDSKIFIHVKYNEPIRFCDNNVKPHDLYLKIKLVNNEGTSVTDSSLLKAKFVRLKDDTLTFEYDIPDKIGGADLDHCITGFDGIIEEYKKDNVTNTKNALNDNYPLKVLTYTGELTGHYNPKGLVEYYSNSLITDLSGNPTKSANIPSPEKNIIIDRIPPKITKINFDVEGNKGIYLGPGAWFAPKISFSEEIFDHNGFLYDYPQVFITEVQIGTNFIFKSQPGRYFDNSGRLVFAKIPIFENMKSTGSDNDLNIISIQNTSVGRPKDKGGNALPNYFPSSETSAAEPWIELTKSLKDELVADKFIVDMEAPEITTSLEAPPSAYGIRCKPILYSYTGSSNADCFYLPFSITDNPGGAGVRPLGDDDIKKGSFQWVLADGGLDLTKLNFSYAVTDSPEPPAPAEWQAGRFSTEYSFPQIAKNQHTADMFLHIRIADLPDLENLSLDGSPVIIKGEDALGNRNTGKWFYFDSSEIKSIFDHNPPDITADRLYNYKENSKWYFAVDFTFFDKSKVDTDGVYYAWMDKGEEPLENDWQKLSGLGSDAQQITAKVTYELEDNKSNDKDLYIKVSDKSFNKNISLGGPYAFSKDLKAPKVEIEASGGITEKAVIKLKALPQTATAQNGEEIPANIIFRIKEPSTTTYSNKTINTVTSAVYDGEVYIENIFASYDGWTLIGDDSSITKSIIDGNFYGEAEVEAYIGYGIYTRTNGFKIENFYDFPVSQEIYSFKLAPGNKKVHNIEMTSSSGLTEDWQSPEDGKKYFNTLSGISFNVSLSNSLMPEWGAKDLDLENSYFALYKEGESEPVYETLLSMSNTITVPDYVYHAGEYKAKAVAKAKTSGRIDTAEITGLFVDTTVPGEFGLSKIVTEFTPKENSNADMLCAKLNENALANPVYFEHQVSETEEQGGDLITMYDKSPYILLGYGENDFVDITRKFYFTPLVPNNELYIKVWNVTDGINEISSKAAASWSKLDEPLEIVFVESTENVLSAYSPCKIPIIKGKENILRYQICHANGNKSEEKVIIADTSNEVPELTIMLTPDEEVPSNEVKALLTNLYSSTTLEMTPYYFNDESSSSITEVTDEISLPKKEGNWFFTKDNYDNYNILNIKAPYLDNIAPAITLESSAGEGDGYAIEARITDENKCKIFMKFDNDYMDRLNLTDYFPLNIPEGEAVKWEADTPMGTGIYRIEKTDIEGGIKLKIYGVYKYDKDNPGDKSIDISIKAIDDAYNTGENSIAVDNVKNTKPQVTIKTEIVWEIVPYSHSGNPNKTEDSFRTYCVRADFNLPIKNITPVPYYKFNNDYSIEKKFLSMFKDGDYTITYNDVFGEYYEEEIAFTIDHAATRYENMNINIYRDSLRKKFSVYAEPVANEGKDFIPANQGSVFTMFDNVYQAAPLYAGHVRALAVHRASVEANDNDKLIIAMMRYDSGWHLNDWAPLIIVDCPADRTPEPTVNWYYHEFASDTVPEGFAETDNNVDVWLSCPIPITSTNDSVLSHTFIHGEDNSYTFEYEYPDGIMGEITVTLPIDIIEKREEQSMEDVYEHDDSTGVDEEDLIFKDKNPPNALFEINRGYGIKLKDKTYWNPEGNDDLENLLSLASFYSLNTIIMDESKTKMVILAGENPSTQDITYENASHEVVEGITISGTVIKVSKPADFTVFIIDEYNNKKSYSFPLSIWNELDYIMPFIVAEEVIYEKTGFSEVEAYFTPKDDKTPPDNIEILSPTGLTKNPEGKYILTFAENKSIEVSMRDLAGNIGSGNISVDSIDDKAPVLALDWWSKGYLDKNTNEIDKKRLTTEKTNQSIMAKIVSDKTIEKVEIDYLENTDAGTLVPSGDEDKYILIENEPDGIYISFLKNAYIWFRCTALNGKEGNMELMVRDIIDKNPPTYHYSLIDDSPEKIKATVNFSNFSEDVYVQGPGESGRLIKKGGSLEKSFFERGAYLFRFTDITGNTVSENVIIENIDEFSPGILLSGIPKAGEYHKDTITFNATMSEEGELTFNGRTKNVNAPVDDDNDGEIQDEECNWVEFSIDQNGSFIIKAVDIAGRETIAYVEIKCFDKIPPTITFKPLTITALSSTDLASLNEMLKSGVTLKDNISDYDKINLTYDKFISNPAKGQYEIKYTATDEAGNVSKATRYIKIYPADEIDVSINDIRTEADSTTTLDKGNLSLTVKKLPLGDNEPYKVYLRKGIWTAGQMKGVSPIADSNSFSINDNGYYTLHLVTQNRGNYTTFLYIK